MRIYYFFVDRDDEEDDELVLYPIDDAEQKAAVEGITRLRFLIELPDDVEYVYLSNYRLGHRLDRLVVVAHAYLSTGNETYYEETQSK